MESIIVLLIIIVYLLIIILIKTNPKIDKIEDDFVISYVVYYTIKGKYGESIRDYFVLIKYNK